MIIPIDWVCFWRLARWRRSSRIDFCEYVILPPKWDSTDCATTRLLCLGDYPDKTFFAHEMIYNEYWMDNVIESLTENVFITFDLDALDPSIMPSTGTPEPGGLLWYETLDFLKQVFTEKNVVGFDIVELCPNPNDKSSDFLAAKLYYKMLSYKFNLNKDNNQEDNYNDTNKNKLTKFKSNE